MAFFLYKGLKKPLVLFGLKDKYIYQAAGFAIGGILCLAILPSMIGYIGLIIGAGIAGIGVWYTFKTQDQKGLYNKTKNKNEIHIFPKKFKYKKTKQPSFIKRIQNENKDI